MIQVPLVQQMGPKLAFCYGLFHYHRNTIVNCPLLLINGRDICDSKITIYVGMFVCVQDDPGGERVCRPPLGRD